MVGVSVEAQNPDVEGISSEDEQKHQEHQDVSTCCHPFGPVRVMVGLPRDRW